MEDPAAINTSYHIHTQNAQISGCWSFQWNPGTVEWLQVQRNSALTTVRGPGGLPSKERARCGVGMGVGNESIHTDRREHRRMVAMKHTYAMAPESARSEFLRVCCLPVRIVPDAKRSVCWESTGRLSCHPSARDSSFPREYWLRKRERSFAGICTGVNEASTPSHHAMPDALPESVPPEGAPPIGHDPPASAGVHYSAGGVWSPRQLQSANWPAAHRRG